MINTPTMTDTIEAALETAQIVENIYKDTSLTDAEQRELVDYILAPAESETTK
jgi:hypothetical protein